LVFFDIGGVLDWQVLGALWILNFDDNRIGCNDIAADRNVFAGVVTGINTGSSEIEPGLAGPG